MASKIVPQNEKTGNPKSLVNQVGKKVKDNTTSEKTAGKKPVKKSANIVPSSVGTSAVDAVKARSSKDVRGSSGLANTGTIISYD